jgi:hypothetical protein
MSAADSEVLAKALEHQSPAVISTGEGKDRRDVLVQFTSARSDSSAVGFWARVHHGDGKLIDTLIKSAGDVVVSFNTSGAKINFKSAVLKKRRRHLIHKLLLLRWPEKISVVEQRQKPRVWVPERFRLTSKIEVLAPGGETLGTAEVRVWDVGLEGASVICPAHPFLLNISGDTSIKLTIRAPDAEKDHTYPATHRYLTRLSDEKVRLGVQFAPSLDPGTAPAHRALKALIEELDAVCGRYDMLGHLNQGPRRPNAGRS